MKTHIPESCRDLTYIAQVDDMESWSIEQLISAIATAASNHAANLGRPKEYYTIVACIAGGEAGVDMADALSERLGLLSNGTQGEFANRRDKKVQVRVYSQCFTAFSSHLLSSSNAFIVYTFQQELVRKTGMRAVRQACGKTFEEVEEFLMSETFPVVRMIHVLYINATFLFITRHLILQPMLRMPSANANLRFSNPLIRLDRME